MGFTKTVVSRVAADVMRRRFRASERQAVPLKRRALDIHVVWVRIVPAGQRHEQDEGFSGRRKAAVTPFSVIGRVRPLGGIGKLIPSQSAAVVHIYLRSLTATKKAGAILHRPSSYRSQHQCQYIRGQKSEATRTTANDDFIRAHQQLLWEIYRRAIWPKQVRSPRRDIYRRDLRADTVPYFFLPSAVVEFANFTCEPAGAAAGVFVLSFFGLRISLLLRN